ncbi:MAG TPA: SprB repeat-containing protein, partial [Chitinophagales bacterium]|nr:SprB repeat-containing protein [Chitinophagales bacterium]
LEWSTYYGGSSSDYGMQVTTASGGFVFLLGATRSVNFPTQNYNATSFFDSQLNNGDTIHYDAGLVKFKDDGSQLWSTYFGGDDDDVRLPFQPLAYMNDQLKADACGNVYGSFVTKSAGLPATNPLCDSYVDGLRGGQRDAFVMQFTRQQKLRWSSYYGGSGEENGLALALDKKNNLTVCGNTDPGTGLPIEVMPLAYNSNSIDSIDAFFGKLVQPTFTPAVTTALCSGACSGEATVAINSLCTATGYAFNWSTGASGNAATGLCAGNYSVTITDTLNCVVDTVDVNITSGITIEPVVDAMSCNFACTGYASVSVPGATSLTYQWSNSTTNAYAAALCPGNYSVTVTAPGCGSDAASFAIVLPPNLEISLSSIEPTCGLSCTAGASVVITGGQTLPYITWDNGVVGPVATNLCPNETYIITASDSLCYSATYVLNVPVAYMTGDIEGINGCGCDNARTVEVYNATNYEIQWSTGDTTATVYNLCPGIYSVTITDSLCGTLVLIDTVIPVPTPYVHNIHSEFAGCPDSCNVLISVKIGPPLPGGGYYQYPGPISMQWTDTAGNPVYGLKCVGETYFFTWTNGCGDTLTGSVTPFPNYLLSASLQVLDYTCPGSCDGVLEVDSIYNGTPPFSLSWSNGYNGYTTYNLCVGDTVILTLGDGCDVELNIPYVFPQASQLSTNTGFSPACAASCNGTAYTFEYNGVTPYTYIWNTGGTDNDIINTCANTWYYVTVTDACDSIATDSVLVELAGPQVNSISTSTSVCALQCNGVATVNSSGGTPPFIYTWSNGSVGFGYYNDQVYNLCALDTYWVAILDPGCSVDTLTFSIPVNQVDIAVSSFVDNDCYYDCNGSIDVTVNGGSPPFGYSWSNGQTSPDIFDLCEDTFVLVVYDPGCSVDSMEVSIGGPEPTQATAQLLDTLNCQYDCLGSGVVIFEGGVPPFSVQWSNGSQDTLTQTLCYGDNFVIVDDPGCWSDTFLLNVSSFSHLAIEAALVSDALCYDSCNGAANVQAFNGVPPYAFAWANDETDDDAVALCAGLAYVTATDDVGCVAVDTVTVAQPPQMGMAAEVTPSHCENADGSASTAMSSGTPPFAFVWSNGATDAAIDGLLPGVYRVTVVDANGCPYYDSIAFDGLYPQLAVSNDTTILIGQPTHLFVSGATDYTWSPSPGLSCDTCEGPAVFTLESVEYCVIG